MDTGITIGKLQGIEEVNRLLADFVLQAGKSSEDALKVVGRRLVVDLAVATYPSTSNGVNRMKSSITGGLNRIFHSTRRVWMTLSRIDRNLADAFWLHEVGKRKNHRKAQKILDSTAQYAGVPVRGQPDPAIHQALRTSSRKHVLARRVRMIVPLMPLVKYQERIYKRIGKSAAGWAVAARSLGGAVRGIPYHKSARRHPEAAGRAVFHAGARPTLVLADDVPYVSQNLSQGTLDAALRHAVPMLRSHLQLLLDAQAGKTLTRKRHSPNASGGHRWHIASRMRNR